MNAWVFGLVLIAILGGIIAALECGDHRKSKRRRKLLNCGASAVGRVRVVERVWGIRPPRFELRAEFEYAGRTYYTVETYGFRPDVRANDPVEIRFDPDDPEENTILIDGHGLRS